MHNNNFFLIVLLLVILLFSPILGRFEGFTTTTDETGKTASVTTQNNNTYDISSANTTNTYDYQHGAGGAYPTTFYSSDGVFTIRVVKTHTDNILVITNNNTGETQVFYVDTTQTNVYIAKNGDKIVIVTTTSPATATLTKISGETVIFSTEQSHQTYDNQVPDPNEVNNYGNAAGDASLATNSLYMLKTQCTGQKPPIIIYKNSYDGKEIPPCPACGRCDKPKMKCEMVPNYNNISRKPEFSQQLADFSTFGM